MDKLKKIRGQKRLKKRIEKWRVNNLQPDLDLINERHYDYVKVWVSPFDNLRYKERDYAGPKSENRTLILNALLDIYESWDLHLKKMNVPYYLKIWLYEPRLTSSQVVCGIKDRIEHYQNVFPPSLDNVVFPNERYQSLKGRLDQFEWKPAVDEEIIENDFWPKDECLTEEDFYYGQRLFRRLEKRMVRKEDLTGESQKLIRYFVPKGIIWIGSKK